MSKFSKIAKAATTLSPVMENRTKIDTKELIDEFPNGITVNECDLVSTIEGSYAIVSFSELSGRFYNCGSLLTNIVTEWVKEYEGDIEACNNDLKASGGVKIVLEESKTASGRNFTKVSIID